MTDQSREAGFTSTKGEKGEEEHTLAGTQGSHSHIM